MNNKAHYEKLIEAGEPVTIYIYRHLNGRTSCSEKPSGERMHAGTVRALLNQYRDWTKTTRQNHSSTTYTIRKPKTGGAS